VEIIPVVDIRNGEVVRAIAGDRANYLPLVTPVASTAKPEDVVRGLLGLHPFTTLYIADLDAIEGRRGGDMSLWDRILGAHPGIRLWVDAGYRSRWAVEAMLTLDRLTAVIGSETGLSPAEVSLLRTIYSDVVLSLDFRGETFLGDPAVLAEPACWPSTVVVMTLGRVGLAAGPDLARLRDIRARGTGAQVYAAGGIRNRDDLEAAREAGAAGALVSTALHAQTITAADLDEISGRI